MDDRDIRCRTAALWRQLCQAALAALCQGVAALAIVAACALAVAALAIALLLGDWLYAGWQVQRAAANLGQAARHALVPGTDEQQLALFLRRYNRGLALADDMTGVLMVPASPPVETLAGRCQVWLYVTIARGAVQRPYVVRGCLSP